VVDVADVVVALDALLIGDPQNMWAVLRGGFAFELAYDRALDDGAVCEQTFAVDITFFNGVHRGHFLQAESIRIEQHVAMQFVSGNYRRVLLRDKKVILK
jgi:hypothetical protein